MEDETGNDTKNRQSMADRSEMCRFTGGKIGEKQALEAMVHQLLHPFSSDNCDFESLESDPWLTALSSSEASIFCNPPFSEIDHNPSPSFLDPNFHEFKPFEIQLPSPLKSS
jgi:hypothetical protein